MKLASPSLFISFVAISLSTYSLGFSASELHSYTGPECGDPKFEFSQRPECGVQNYMTGRAEVCGVEQYSLGSDPSCPGSDPGGRVIGGFNSPFTSRIFWQNGDPSYGGEDLTTAYTTNDLGRLVSSNTRSDIFNFQPGTVTVTYYERELEHWSCRASSIVRKFGSKVDTTISADCTTKPINAVCAKPEFGVALYKACENPIFGVKRYNWCDDKSKPIYKTCELRKNRGEIETFVTEVTTNIDFQAELYATNLANFVVRSQDKASLSCLIDRYSSIQIYENVVNDLIEKFEVSFGEPYQKDYYADKCVSGLQTPADLTYLDLQCSTLSSSQIREGIANSDEDRKLKRFYQDCFAQKAYLLPLSWFQFNLSETSLLLDDIVAKQDPSLKEKLLEIQEDLKKAQVIN